MIRRLWAFGVVAIAIAGPATPALAVTADPGRSAVQAMAPSLAPGVFGSAPLYGEMDGAGGMTLRAPTSRISTGNPVYDAVLRRLFAGAITLRSGPMTLVRRNGRTRRLTALADVQAGVGAARLPLTIRATDGAEGTTVRTFFAIPLAPYGVVSPTGGSPGSVRIAITAFFPGGK